MLNAFQMQEKRQTDIDFNGQTVIIHHWSTLKALSKMPKLGRYFAVPISTIFGSFADANISQKANFAEDLPTALVYFFGQLEEKGLEDLISMLMDGVTDMMGQPINLDNGNFTALDVLKLITEVIKANYSDFFDKGAFQKVVDWSQSMGMMETLAKVDTKENQTA